MMYQTVLIENITTENVTEKMCSSDGLFAVKKR